MAKEFNNPYVEGGDSFVLFYEGKYYLYSTCDTENSYYAYIHRLCWQTYKGERDGFEVYVSDDMQSWTNLGYCLEKGKGAVGKGLFWAPEVYYHNGKFYMLYAADEHCCIASSDSPVGPFVSEKMEYLIDEPSIDSHLLFDDDGKIYLYYSRVRNGNKIKVAEMEADLSGIKKIYDDILIQAVEPWETIQGDVAEGPFVLKHKGIYYLSYSCNSTICKDYAVGYAVSKSPIGPFEKYEGNPILIGNNELRGCGHHSFFYDGKDLICVHHCHNPYGEILTPRRVCFRNAGFKENPDGEADILYID